MRSATGESSQQPVYVTSVGAGGAASAGGTLADPTYERSLASANFATAQVTTSISPAAAVLLVAARSGRRSVTITNVTGAQPIYILTSTATTGATTGDFIPGTVGASKTIPTSAAIYGTSPTAGQVVSILETY